MPSGGSAVSASWTSAARTVTTHATPSGSGASGVSVKVSAGDALSTKERGAPIGHARVNAAEPAVTGSLNVTVTAVRGATPDAPASGVVETTDGADGSRTGASVAVAAPPAANGTPGRDW